MGRTSTNLKEGEGTKAGREEDAWGKRWQKGEKSDGRQFAWIKGRKGERKAKQTGEGCSTFFINTEKLKTSMQFWSTD